MVFAVVAAGYVCSALVRAITATLSPVLMQEFALQARDLGLLAGGRHGFQAAMGALLCCCIASYAYFISQPGLKVDNHLQ